MRHDKKSDRFRRTPSRHFSENKPGTTAGLIRVYGRNPVLDLLKLKVVRRLEIAHSAQGPVITAIVKEAKLQNIPVSSLRLRDADELVNHQGVFAEIVPPKLRHDLFDFLESLSESSAPLLLMLDGISDPHNYGAILRTAVASEVTAVIVREKRQAPLNETVVKTSAGAAAKIPVFQVANLNQTLDKIAEFGFWSVAACQETDSVSYDQFDWSGKTVLILGAEGEGVSELLLKNADRRITIPISPRMESLNVSVAAGILLFSALKSRGILTPKS